MLPYLKALDDAWVHSRECLDLVIVPLGLPGRLNSSGQGGVVPQHNQPSGAVHVAADNLQQQKRCTTKVLNWQMDSPIHACEGVPCQRGACTMLAKSE